MKTSADRQRGEDQERADPAPFLLDEPGHHDAESTLRCPAPERVQASGAPLRHGAAPSATRCQAHALVALGQRLGRLRRERVGTGREDLLDHARAWP